ncbi:MAG: hypothetical protein Rpha_0950 [Candidatus Ruthia sp. Apha_13_S6]|nr:hypothetical protein [Candidatus Ruthia sp. Apha_13_S6]
MHNDTLEIGVDLGFVGLGLFFIVVVALLSALWKIVKLEDNANAWFYYLLFVCLSALFVNMQFSFPHQLAMPAVLFGFYAGFLAKKSEQFLPKNKTN